jgi:branched-chain amino acid transport system permease protein
MGYLLALLIDGVLAGALYALVALAFVVVYKASRMINFALGEWMMLGSRLTSAALHATGLGLIGAITLACVGMAALAVVWSAVVLRRLLGQPLIALIMVTIGLGLLMRGAAFFLFAGVPATLPLPFSEEPIMLAGVPVSPGKLAAAAVSGLVIALLTWFFRASRTGLALRAIASDQQAAMMVGIDVHRHFTFTWILAGALAVLSAVLWTTVSGGGFRVELVAVRVFPIVIIGGLDSIPGTIVGAILIGVLESLTAGYVDPLVGGGSSLVAAHLVLLAVLFVRPYGLFGRPDAERV